MIIAGLVVVVAAAIAIGVAVERWEQAAPHRRYRRARDAMRRAHRRAAGPR